MATKIATPMASAACRIILITPEPVANDDDRRQEAATPIRVGNVSPTPMPVGIMPMMTSAAFGSSPITLAQEESPDTEKKMPAEATVRAAKAGNHTAEKSSGVDGGEAGPSPVE